MHKLKPIFFTATKALYQRISILRNDISLLQRYPSLSKTEHYYKNYTAQMIPYYENYVDSVSTAQMAASLQVISLAIVLASMPSIRTVVDLGSGFSSFALRYFSDKLDVSVWSVDDSLQWLGKTEDYLKDMKVSTENLLTWEEFQSTDKPKFDLVFHDLGNMDTRLTTLGEVLKLGSNDCLLLLDDMHKSNYARSVHAMLKDAKWKYWSLKSFTIDDLSRYSGLAVRD